jgi:hypothetical protein
LRRKLAEGGVPQPRYAAVRAGREAAPAAETVGFPAVLKPADSGGQRGLFLLQSFDDLDRHLHAALVESPTGEAILEEFTDGLELNGLVVARGGEPYPLLLSDRLRPPGDGLRRRLDPLVPVEALRRRASRRRSASRSAPCGRSGCRTGSPSRS